VTIDRSGTWWVGSEAQDLESYLRALVDAEDGYPVEAFRLARCKCGSELFELKLDRDQTAAQRTCLACGSQHFVCDSEEVWEGDLVETCTCIECRSTQANLGCGFALREDGEVRWIYLGVRCATCGILGCYADWQIRDGDSTHLMEQV